MAEGDLANLMVQLIQNLNYKLGFFLFIFLIFVFDDCFVYSILGPLGAVEDGQPTARGSFLQYLFIILFVIIIEFATHNGIL
jgi:hypothetical protein